MAAPRFCDKRKNSMTIIRAPFRIEDMANCLIISDLQIPFENKKSLEFCVYLKKHFGVADENCFCVGDETNTLADFTSVHLMRFFLRVLKSQPRNTGLNSGMRLFLK